MKTHFANALLLAVGTATSLSAHAWFVILPIPNVAKPPELQSIIDALEKSDETKAVAYVSEDKLFAAKVWTWGEYPGHVPQAEANRIALSRCAAKLDALKARRAGGQPVYDFGTKKCELHEFVNSKESAMSPGNATPTASVPSSTANTGPSSAPLPLRSAAVVCQNYGEVMRSVVYPEEALKVGLEGQVVLEFTVKATGEIGDAIVKASTNSLFDKNSLAVIEKLRCNTGGGDVRVQAPLSFRMAANTGAQQPRVPLSESTPAQPSQDNDRSPAQRLRALEQLKKEGLITQQEYDDKRKAILSAL